MSLQFSYSKAQDGTESFVIIAGGGVHLVPSEHANFTAIKEALLSGDADEDEVTTLVNATVGVSDTLRRLSDRVTVRRDTIFFDGDPMESRLTRHIVDMIREGDDNYSGYVAFLENVQANPSRNSRQALFRFLEKHDLVITEDGHFIGYKGISSDGRSVSSGTEEVTVTLEDGTIEVHTGRIPNPVGATVEMARSLVDPDINQACSVGLHVGNHTYATGFGSVLLTVKVNPRDVVSVPDDSNDQKIRTCRYVILEQNDERTRYQGTSYVENTVPEYEPDGDEDDELDEDDIESNEDEELEESEDDSDDEDPNW